MIAATDSMSAAAQKASKVTKWLETSPRAPDVGCKTNDKKRAIGLQGINYRPLQTTHKTQMSDYTSGERVSVIAL